MFATVILLKFKIKIMRGMASFTDHLQLSYIVHVCLENPIDACSILCDANEDILRLPKGFALKENSSWNCVLGYQAYAGPLWHVWYSSH